MRWKHSVTCTDPKLRWSWRKWRRLPEARISHCNNSTATEAVSLTWWQARVAEVVDPEWRPNGWRHSGRWPTVRLRKMCRHLVRLCQQPDRVRHHSAIQSHLISNYVTIIIVLSIYRHSLLILIWIFHHIIWRKKKKKRFVYIRGYNDSLYSSRYCISISISVSLIFALWCLVFFDFFADCAMMMKPKTYKN